MPPHPCPTCKKNRIRIYNMLAAGRSEDQIIQGFVAEEGENVLWVTPGLVGRLGPYAALTFGFVVVVLVIRRYRRNANVSAGVLPDDGEPA
jgi:cytochrome c-type biogenesis protein CcmH/NrfF